MDHSYHTGFLKKEVIVFVNNREEKQEEREKKHELFALCATSASLRAFSTVPKAVIAGA